MVNIDIGSAGIGRHERTSQRWSLWTHCPFLSRFAHLVPHLRERPHLGPESHRIQFLDPGHTLDDGDSVTFLIKVVTVHLTREIHPHIEGILHSFEDESLLR